MYVYESVYFELMPSICCVNKGHNLTMLGGHALLGLSHRKHMYCIYWPIPTTGYCHPKRQLNKNKLKLGKGQLLKLLRPEVNVLHNTAQIPTHNPSLYLSKGFGGT